MTKSYKSMLTYLVILAVLLAAWWWLKLSADLKPQDVQLEARFVQDAVSGWGIDATITNASPHSLGESDRITPYMEGVQTFNWHTAANEPGFGTGSSQEAQNNARAMLQNMQISPSEDELGNSFFYSGTKKTITAHADMHRKDGSAIVLEGTKAFLIYSHIEHKWGRNLSWTKVVPVKKP